MSMLINLSKEMIEVVFDVLANAEPYQLEIEHGEGENIVTGQDALELFSRLRNEADHRN